MHTPCFSPELPLAVRGACLVASGVATIGILGALLSAWYLQADPVWLAATPEVLADVAACERGPDRAARMQCKQALVLAHTQPTQAVVLAWR